jgi:hypothetical protein
VAALESLASRLRGGEELLAAGFVGREEPVPVGQGRPDRVHGEEPAEPGLHQRELLVGDDAGAGHLLDDRQPVREPPDDDVEVAHGVAAEEPPPLQRRLQGLEAPLGLAHHLALRLAGGGEDRVQGGVALDGADTGTSSPQLPLNPAPPSNGVWLQVACVPCLQRTWPRTSPGHARRGRPA